MNLTITASSLTTPDYIDPVIAIPVAIALAAIYFIIDYREKHPSKKPRYKRASGPSVEDDKVV